MFCTQCGKSVDQQDVFCRFCGNALQQGAQRAAIQLPDDPRMRQIMENLDWHAGGGRRRWIMKLILVAIGIFTAISILGAFLGVFSEVLRRSS